MTEDEFMTEVRSLAVPQQRQVLAELRRMNLVPSEQLREPLQRLARGARTGLDEAP
ncbi:hypothetical protein [Paracoccus versutus]|uniref:Uncharacterized protein n=1 Tax=Paracoccus versutus TaxID=34007 RepID=A0A3D9XP37_PARVE|nr:hypothetical protein [Paracoccus versutus]REF69932.1 hypothetical protein BDD41_2651 [Paracoccus versutus]